jgi:hypothetical protein
LRYEDLVAEPDRWLERIFGFLGVAPFDQASRRYADVDLAGAMGDKRGAASYSQVSTEPVDVWPPVLATPLRRAWARRYLRWIGGERLAAMGYDRQEILQRLAEEPLVWGGTLSDVGRMSYGWYAVSQEVALFRKKKALSHRGLRIDVPNE